MSLAFIIYAIDSLSSIRILSWVALIVATIATILFFFCACSQADDKKDYRDDPVYIRYRKYFINGLCYIGAIALFIALVPNKETSYTILAAHVAQKMYESPESAKLQGKVLTILNNKLDSYIDQLPKEKKEEK